MLIDLAYFTYARLGDEIRRSPSGRIKGKRSIGRENITRST